MKNNNFSVLSFDSALTLVFIILKLCKVIDWSWWWVLSPIWIVLGIVLIIIFLAALAEYLNQ